MTPSAIWVDRRELFEFSIEQLRPRASGPMRWRPYAMASYVNWCGHGQEVIPIPETERECRMIPVLGEAT